MSFCLVLKLREKRSYCTLSTSFWTCIIRTMHCLVVTILDDLSLNTYDWLARHGHNHLYRSWHIQWSLPCSRRTSKHKASVWSTFMNGSALMVIKFDVVLQHCGLRLPTGFFFNFENCMLKGTDCFFDLACKTAFNALFISFLCSSNIGCDGVF